MGICVSCRRRERKAPEKRTAPGAGGPVKGAAAAELLPRRIDRLPMMANSMTNIKIKNPIKIIVSKHRRRYMKDGFNLDLAYITDRLIAMGFPAEKLEGVYRNHIDEVYRFLEKMHKDHYKIYNLCTERSYDSSKFHERVERYAFDDHTPPSIEMIQPFCQDVHNWLSADSKNVAAVHCKAGKGRTGTMICCYLLYSRQKTTADEALKFYGTERTYDDKGVTIPSQRRYVEYYAWLLKSGLQYAPTKVHIRELVITPPPFQYAGGAVPELQITQWNPFIKAPIGCHEVRRSETSLHVHLTHCTPLYGDVRVGLNNKHKMKMRKEKLFHFWFNTFFVAVGVGAVSHPPLSDSPNLETFKLTLNKWQLDDAHKDDKHKNFSQDFKVELIIQKLPDSSTFSGRGGGARPPSPSPSPSPSPPSSSASSCSEPDTEPDAHWDSGERLFYCPLGDCDAVPDYTSAVGELASAVPDYNSAVGRRKPSDRLHARTKNGNDNARLASDGPKKFAAFDYSSDRSHKKTRDSESDNAVDARSRERESPTVNPLYCSKADSAKVTEYESRNPSHPAAFFDTNEPMEYSNEVFSSAPASARESPVEECKAKRTDDRTKPRLSLGDMRASWREFSGKFASDSRRRKES